MRHGFAVAVTSALLSAACGQADADSPPDEALPQAAPASGSNAGESSLAMAIAEPCGLISEQEMGELLLNPVSSNQLGRGLCEYSPADVNVGRVGAEVFIQNVEETGCELYYSVGGFNSATEVAGVGSSARWKSNVKQLGVCVDERFTLTITLYDPGQHLAGPAQHAAVARAVADHLLAQLS